jgi:hypothetical protein
LGDLNAKSPAFGCKSSSTSGNFLANFVLENDLLVLNNRDPTYFSHSIKDYSEILDLALCSPSAASKLIEFEVLSDMRMGSDHAPISTHFAFSPRFTTINETIRKA